MKRALQEVSDMATSLEASGMDRQQAGATLEAIANSIEKFAVTPERLRVILEESQQALYERIKAENDLRFDGIGQRIEGVNQKFEGVNHRFDRVNQKFEGVNHRFDRVNQQFEGVNRRFEGVNQRFEGVNEKFEGINQRFEGVNEKFEGINLRFDGVNRQFDAVNQRFDDVNLRLDDLTKNTNERFNDVLAELRAVSSKLFNLTLAMALGIAGVAGIWLIDQLF